MIGKHLIAVLDYGIGNLRSAQKALEYVGANAELTSDPSVIKKADAVVLPGVGAFGRCIQALSKTGLFEIASKSAVDAINGGKFFLGICVGLQLLFESSEESPELSGLEALSGKVSLIKGDVKRPHMQWNKISWNQESLMFEGLENGEWMYFVHSYVAPITNATVATCHYGERLCAAQINGNLWATQFHPEKSGQGGLRILKNFVDSVGGV